MLQTINHTIRQSMKVNKFTPDYLPHFVKKIFRLKVRKNRREKNSPSSNVNRLLNGVNCWSKRGGMKEEPPSLKAGLAVMCTDI